MNLFRKLASIFTKMSPSKKADKLAEKLVQQEKTKVEPIRDIEDIVKATKSPYFSPIQTRHQRIKKTRLEEIKPIPSLVHEAVVVTAASKRKAKETKKTTEMKELLEDLKKLPAAEIDCPLEVLPKEDTVAVSPKKPVKDKTKKKEVVAKPKKIPKESPKATKIKAALDVSTEPQKEEKALSPAAVKGKRKSKNSPKSPELKVEKWEPNKWTEVLDNIKLMRASADAPVDTMGCHKCSDENADQKTQRFQTLVALMLSSQTKDQVTYEAMSRLKENKCTPVIIAEMDSQKLETLLYPVSFYKNKAKYLKNTSKILVEKYDSDIPNNVKELIKLPGVGPKMAHICMSSAWDIVTGIGVDVHVHRISNRLGWVRKETKEPEQTRKELESWLPSDRWKEVNYLLVGFGQTVCMPTKPKCSECLNNAICPSAKITKSKKLKKEKLV